MKKSIFIAVLGVVSAAASYGQGVFFNNYQTSTQTQGVTFAGGNGGLSGLGVGSEFNAILLYGPAGSTLLSQLAPIGSPVAFATSLGYSPVTPGGAIGGGSGSGWFGKPTINFPLYGTTYTVAIEAIGSIGATGYIGYSSLIQYTTKANSGVPTSSLPSFLTLGNFTVDAVPEPTTLALAGLGGLASLVMLRRKQA